MLEIDSKELRRLERDLKLFAARAAPFAARNALNESAFTTRAIWIEKLDEQMVLRNTFTTRSIRVEKATGYSVAAMQAVVGSVAPYLEVQEEGGTIPKKSSQGKPIPTTTAAGQGMKAKPRTKPVQRKNWLGAINVASRVSGNRQRKNAVAILLAARGSGVAYLNLGRRKGLFRVTGTKRGLRVRMLWDLSRSSVTIKRRSTLAPSLETLQPRLAGIWEGAIREQLKRAKILGYR